ncbi:hypothetical protein G5S_0314 [Chlamydia pecorum E58]|uniref:Uncharacterized protein n=1 Tax=Chlamydia pecorum (strain ATCC VR-628 / DSM 29919 / E58) TaxID=331635 RepID=A0AA34RCQ1_CHLPE|nr:hypothetical protein G5S_0314 [Chlamydia pecorum E58]
MPRGLTIKKTTKLLFYYKIKTKKLTFLKNVSSLVKERLKDISFRKQRLAQGQTF